MINSFSGEYRCLSNFYPCLIVWDEAIFPTVEHAYQASKTNDLEEFQAILSAKTPGEAKRLGRKVKNSINADCMTKIRIMTFLLEQKFNQPEFKELLLATGDQEIVEGNTWNDTFWGVCDGKGNNFLGEIIMGIRYQLKFGMFEND